jgi:AcrR family transcriptional regulator
MTRNHPPEPAATPSVASWPIADEWSQRRRDARDNHQRIVAAALRCFAEHGLRATIPQIAEAAGVGKATVYRSYPTKQELVAAVARHQLAAFEAHVGSALSDPDPATALRRYVEELFTWLAGDRILADALADGEAIRIDRLLGPLGGLLTRARAAGAVHADVTPLDLRTVLCGAVRQLIALDVRDVATWRHTAGLVLNAYRP